MKVTILGCGTNIDLKKAGTCFLVETDHRFLIDFGPRSLINMLKAGVNRHSLRTLLITHLHADHVSEFIPFFFDAVFYSKMIARRSGLTLYGPKGSHTFFHSLLATFPSFTSARFRVDVRELSHQKVRLGKTTITAREVAHSPRLHSLGYRVDYKGRSFVYSGDTGPCQSLVDLCRGADLAILESSFPDQHPSPEHLTASQAGAIARKAGVKRLVLTHLYPVCQRYNITQQCKRTFQGKVVVARDLMRFTL